jgi:hypothetical protein
MARYLVALRPTLLEACNHRNDLVKRIGVLMVDAKSGDLRRVVQGAGQLGGEFGTRFRQSSNRLQALKPPSACDVCHATMRAWLEHLERACEALTLIGRTGQLSGLRVAQQQLADGRIQAHRFNEEYARLVEEIRLRVSTARRRGDQMPKRRQYQPS